MSSNKLPNPLDQLNEHEQSHRHLTGGECLFVQNTDAAGLYYLVSGVVDLRRSTHQGHDVIMHRAHSEDTFAEASLFAETYHCSATARGDAYVIECRRSSVLKMLESNGEFARSMMRRFASSFRLLGIESSCYR